MMSFYTLNQPVTLFSNRKSGIFAYLETLKVTFGQPPDSPKHQIYLRINIAR
ncbi:hypothetical protein Xind_01798 [Xenorhabdus indica]|nr:hypothetical protein [Xenorhabdus indica]